MSLNTYAGWQKQDMGVAQGEKAEEYGRLEDGSWVALFRDDQVESRPAITMDDVVETQTLAERADSRKGKEKDSRPKIIVDIGSDGQSMKIWVGSSKRGLELVRNSKFKFDPRTHRWLGTRPDPVAVVAELRSRGFNVTGDCEPGV